MFEFLNFYLFYHQRTPLHVAAGEGCTDIVRFLADKVPDINITDILGVIIYT